MYKPHGIFKLLMASLDDQKFLLKSFIYLVQTYYSLKGLFS
jgi:hypothetical protein